MIILYTDMTVDNFNPVLSLPVPMNLKFSHETLAGEYQTYKETETIQREKRKRAMPNQNMQAQNKCSHT